MLKIVIAASFCALVAATPFAAAAQTTTAPQAHPHSVHKPTGSYRSEMRKRHTTARDRARASAEHMRQLRAQ